MKNDKNTKKMIKKIVSVSCEQFECSDAFADSKEEARVFMETVNALLEMINQKPRYDVEDALRYHFD